MAKRVQKSERVEALFRIIVLLISGFIIYIWGYLIYILAILNWTVTIFTGKRNKEIARIIEIIEFYSNNILFYLPIKVISAYTGK